MGPRRFAAARPFVKQTKIARHSATLVRGEDTYGHFELESAPKADAARAAHAEAMARQVVSYYKGIGKTEMRA